MFYSSFREELWWWEATVAIRKAGLALIGVFGADLELMQVHLTMAALLVVIMMTSHAEPYGGEASQMIGNMELMTLLATWLTLWCGSVFNTYPKCQDPRGKEGDTLAWCEAMSVLIGIFDVLVLLAVVVGFLWVKLDKTGSSDRGSLRSRAGSAASTFADKILHAARNRRQQSVELATMSGGADNAVENPAVGMAGADKAAAETARLQRQTRAHMNKHHSRDETRVPEGWDKYFTEDGERYYAEHATGVSSWEAPAGATGGSTGRPHRNAGEGAEPEIGVEQVYEYRERGEEGVGAAASGMSFITNPAAGER